MSNLGTFGGSAPHALRISAGGSVATGDLMDESLKRQIPSPQGMPALSQQLAQLLAGYGNNLITNGSFESWSGGTTSAPDGWTLSGAGATIARNTTSGQISQGLASCSVTAALNTITRLSQTITISATQNTRLRGKQVIFSAQVFSSTAIRVNVEIDDGVVVKTSSLQHTGSGVFELLFVTVTLDSAATQIKVSLLISSGASITVHIDAAKLEEGATATSWTAHSNDAFLQSRLVTDDNGITTTDTVNYVDMTDMVFSNVIVDGNQSVMLMFSAQLTHSVTGGVIIMHFDRSGTMIPATSNLGINLPVAGQTLVITMTFLDVKPAAGNYTYKVRWKISTAGTGTVNNKMFQLFPIPAA